MITLIVPTRNRAHTLSLIGESFYRLELVNEIIFVNDAGTDDTAAVVGEIARRHPHVSTRILNNEHRLGASGSRIKGYEAAANDYILYSDDDIYIEPDYAAVCLRKMRETGAGIASGRIIRKRFDQTPEAAIAAFGTGTSDKPPFRKWVCEVRGEAKTAGDVYLPLTGPVILTTRALLRELSYDGFYSRGNGYREESDFQMHAFVTGHAILMTNDTHCAELSRIESKVGGQRTARLKGLYWAVYYNAYFYRKYYDRYAALVGLKFGRRTATALFALYQLHAYFIRPFGYRFDKWVARQRERRAMAAQEKNRTSGRSLSQAEW
ncbi:MAG TPA: glycosyltransferase [Alphaproteobacteria bacterium]|jgi:glycosyltransferase involved in cell wall biosynthesis